MSTTRVSLFRGVLCAGAMLIAAAATARENVIRDARVDRPSIFAGHDRVTLSARLVRAGRVTVGVIDRDGYRVRTLANNVAVLPGAVSWPWDGRDDSGSPVPDEAYSWRIDWSSGSAHETWFPANRKPADMLTIPVRYYDARGGTLAYVLPVAARVHIQCGTAFRDPKTSVMDGAVMKTLVNREPRQQGSVAEHWTGFDESGQIYVPALPGFVTAIAATPLPECAVITYGNHARAFLEHAAARKGRSELTFSVATHEHHRGLTALDDTSPPLLVEPIGLRWSADDRTWHTTQESVVMMVTPSGPTAAHFIRQPAKLYRFVNGRIVAATKTTAASERVVIPTASLEPGANTITVNWLSEYGTVAVSSIRVTRSPARPQSETAGKGGTP